MGGVDLHAIAVTGNLTVTGQTRAGYVGLTTTTTAPSGIPATSTLNFPLGDNRANGVTIALAADGGLWATYVGAGASTTATANLIFDVTGYFNADATGVTYHPLTSARILDTRNDIGLIGPFPSKVTPRVRGDRARGRTRRTRSRSPATSRSPSRPRAGYVSLTTTAQSVPATSTINFPLGDIRANGVTVPLAGDGKLWATYVGHQAGTAPA